MHDRTRHLILGILLITIGISIIVIRNPFNKAQFEEGEALGIKEIPKTGIELGSKAPNFILKDIDGNLVKLSEFKGKPVVINFWASWCTYCLEEMPDFEFVAGKYNDSVVILGINRAESQEVASDYARNRLPVEITYPVLLDSNEDVSSVYILRGMPVTYFIDENAIIKNRYFGKITREIMEQEIEKLLI